MTTRPSRTGSDRSAGASRRIAELRKAERSRAARRRATVRAGTVAVLVLIVGLGVLLQTQRAHPGGPPGNPAGVVDGTGFSVGDASAPVTVEVYEDFQCPACRQFEQLTGPALHQLAAAGTARVLYRPIAFLDGASTTRYSTRALNAAGCAADAGAFPAMHDQLFANQPPEGGAGLPNAWLIQLGQQAGATGEQFDRCVREMRYRRWTAQVTDTASKKGITGTPSVFVNGRPLANPTPDNLRSAVQAARRSAPSSTPSSR